jgi:hypothetical protein
VKARPRSVEREVAKRLSLFYSRHGLSPVERLPVLGRTGPDISLNEAEIAVDVKSRVEVPKGVLLKKGRVAVFGAEMLGVRLGDLDLLCDPNPHFRVKDYFASLSGWLAHMADWLPENCPQGIPALVLHRPHMHINNSTFVIYLKDRSEFHDRCNRTNHL